MEGHFGPYDGEENHADHRVEAEERFLRPLHAAPAHQPVFKAQQDHDDQHSDPVRETEAREQSQKDQQSEHQDVREQSGLQGVVWPPAHDERMQFVSAVKIVILNGVDHVEADEPEEHHDGHGGGQQRAVAQVAQHLLEPMPARRVGGGVDELEAARHGNPRAHRRQCEREAQHHVGEIGEAFGEGVKENHRQCRGGQHEAKWVDEITDTNERGAADPAQDGRAEQADPASGQVAVFGARIECVYFVIGDSVEGHRGGARRGHGRDDEQE